MCSRYTRMLYFFLRHDFGLVIVATVDVDAIVNIVVVVNLSSDFKFVIRTVIIDFIIVFRDIC